MVFRSLSTLLGTLACLWPPALLAEPGPASWTYRGFPVYPPQQLAAIHGRSKFRLPIPERRALLARTSDKLVVRALSRAETHLTTQPQKLGWRLLMSDVLGDGGSPSWEFGKLVGGRPLLVLVTFYSAGGNVSDEKEWGTVEYMFVTPRPLVRRGFPLCAIRPGTQVAERTVTEGVVLEVQCDNDGRGGALASLAPLYGWKHVTSAASLWQRGDQLVRDQGGGSRQKWLFMSATHGKQVLAGYSTPAKKSATVNRGCLVYHGWLVPRPYRIVLADGKITVNGVVIHDVARRHKEGQLDDFDHEVRLFEHHGVTIMGQGMTTTGHRPSDTEVQDFISGVTAALSGGSTAAEKLQRLRRVKSLHGMPAAALEELVRNWNRKGPPSPATIPAPSVPSR